MKNSFFLVIPAQQQSLELLVPYEKETVIQWIKELPTANPSLSTRLFYDYIDGLNKVVMPAQQRLDILELLRPSLLLIEESLRSRLLVSGFPKGENEQKIFNILGVIERNFTTGYWVVIRELTKRNTSWFKARNLALAIQRAIKGLSEIVVTHYIMCRAVPDWVWIDLHSLYKLSVKAKKETTKVPDASRSFNKVSTAEECYKQVLLLSLAGPAGLMQKEITRVYHFIANICQYIQIEQTPIVEQKEQCIILMDEDSKPFWQKSGNQEDSAIKYLNFLSLYHKLQQSKQFINDDEARFSSLHKQKNTAEKISRNLFIYVQQCWKGETNTGGGFFVDRLDRYIAIGLDATHALQTQSKNTGEGEDEEAFEFLAESFSDKELACSFDAKGVLSIGSLVSFRKTNEPESRRVLSIVKRITIPKQNEKIIFELAAISPISYAVSYTSLDLEDDVHHKALLYGVKDKSGERSYIIVESFMHKNEDGLRLFMSGRNFPIVLGNRKNIGLGYWQFECRQIEEKQVEQVVKAKGFDFI